MNGRALSIASSPALHCHWIGEARLARGGGRLTGAICLLLFFALSSSGATATFTATLDRNVVAVGESAVMTLMYQDGTPDELPTLPAVTNLTFRSTGNQKSQFSIVNGRSSAQVIHDYWVTPSRPGDYTIPAITASIEGRRLSSAPLAFKVLPAGSRTPAAEVMAKTAFLKLVAPKNEGYLGEVIPLEVRLYARQGRLKQAPQINQVGFTAGKLLQQPQTSALYGGQSYHLLIYKTYVIPARTGRLSLGPATMVLELPRPNSRISIFGDPLEVMDVTLTSDALEINALPLPTENVPADFTGAVGNYTLAASASTNTVTAGDTITLTVQLAGAGPIESLALPSLDHWRDFKVYPPVTRTEITDTFGLQGSKTFEQVVIPENTGIKELPAISFSFFDPEKKSYRTVAQAAVPLTVRPSSAAPAQPLVLATGTQGGNEPKVPTDIVHIKARPGLLGQIRPPLVQQGWFLALQAVPVLGWLGVVVWRRRAERLAANPRMRRRREVARVVRAGLEELRRLAAADQSDEFFATVFRLLQEQLGERLDMPASAITESVVDEKLAVRGLAEPVRRELHELFQSCNQARYAPQRSREELNSLVPKVEAALAALKEVQG